MRRRTEFFLIGALTGVVVGVVVGLLFAPASGERTRKAIADEALRAADYARAMAEKAERMAESGRRPSRPLPGARRRSSLAKSQRDSRGRTAVHASTVLIVVSHPAWQDGSHRGGCLTWR